MFTRISILGVGLLGGSIGLALQSAREAGRVRVVGYGHRRQTLDAAMRCGAIDEAANDPARAVEEADFVVLCTPVGLFPEILRQIAPALKAGAIISDVGSTKRSILQLADELLPAPLRGRFVGSHPMAGGEKRGVEHARADLFRDALCILTPTERTDPAALAAVERFWRDDLAMRITRTSPEDHDRLLASVSHLPHALAAAVVLMQSSAGLALAGPGFRDMTRVAGGDAGLWRDIFIDNADNLRAAARELREQLDRLESLLDPARAEELRKWLDAAAKIRNSL